MNHSNEIREKIKKELINLGYDISLCGTLYLSECLYIIINREIEGILNLKKEIYPIVAEKYQKDVNDIRSNINYATIVMYNRNNNLKQYSNFYENIKPTIKQVIYIVLDKIAS